jgi:hypothetical protein
MSTAMSQLLIKRKEVRRWFFAKEVKLMGCTPGSDDLTIHDMINGMLQEELGLDSAQMLMYVVPIAFMIQTVCIPMFDTIHGPDGLAEYEWTIEIVLWITLTCFMAFGFNITFFLAFQEVREFLWWPLLAAFASHIPHPLILLTDIATHISNSGSGQDDRDCYCIVCVF